MCRQSLTKRCKRAIPCLGDGQVNEALLRKSKARREDPYPRRSYAMAATGTVVGHPSCVKRLSKATRTCSSTT